MFEILKQYLVTGYMKFKDGQIFFGKEKIAFYFVPQLVREFKYNYKLFGIQYGAAIFLAGVKQGETFVQKHGIPLKKHLSAVVKISCDVLSQFGFGNFKPIKVNDKDGFMVIVGKSTLAMDFKENLRISENPIDFMLGGLFTGALGHYAGKKLYCVEIACASQKDVKECSFVIGPEDKIYAYLNEFSPTKLEWAKKFIGEVKKLEGNLAE